MFLIMKGWDGREGMLLLPTAVVKALLISGIARGCGWQHIGAFVNLAAFYLFGIPIAAILGFWVNMRGRGLWIGILSGATVQTLLLTIITCCTNWEKAVCLIIFFQLHSVFLKVFAILGHER